MKSRNLIVLTENVEFRRWRAMFERSQHSSTTTALGGHLQRVMESQQG